MSRTSSFWNRRLDSRTDGPASLRNLLRVRALRHGYGLAVLGTLEGLVLAASREDRSAAEAAAVASLALTRRRSRFFASQAGGRTVHGLVFDVGPNQLFVAVQDRRSPDRRREHLLELAERVGAILAQHEHRPAA